MPPAPRHQPPRQGGTQQPPPAPAAESAHTEQADRDDQRNPTIEHTDDLLGPDLTALIASAPAPDSATLVRLRGYLPHPRKDNT